MREALPSGWGSKKSRAGVCNSTVATACATGHASIGISITDSRFRKMEIPSLPLFGPSDLRAVLGAEEGKTTLRDFALGPRAKSHRERDPPPIAYNVSRG